MEKQLIEELRPLNWLENYELPSFLSTDESERFFNSSSTNEYFSFSQMAFLAIENSPRKRRTVSSIISFCRRNFIENISFEAWKLHLKYTLISNPAFFECCTATNSKFDSHSDSMWTYRIEYRKEFINSFQKLSECNAIPITHDVKQILRGFN
nr:hypothetical transcript [Hymenolepis microstoma]